MGCQVFVTNQPNGKSKIAQTSQPQMCHSHTQNTYFTITVIYIYIYITCRISLKGNQLQWRRQYVIMIVGLMITSWWHLVSFMIKCGIYLFFCISNRMLPNFANKCTVSYVHLEFTVHKCRFLTRNLLLYYLIFVSVDCNPWNSVEKSKVHNADYRLLKNQIPCNMAKDKHQGFAHFAKNWFN